MATPSCFEAWVRRGYDARVDGAQVHRAAKTAAKATGLDRWEDLSDYLRQRAMHRLAGSGQDALHKSTVAAPRAWGRLGTNWSQRRVEEFPSEEEACAEAGVQAERRERRGYMVTSDGVGC